MVGKFGVDDAVQKVEIYAKSDISATADQPPATGTPILQLGNTFQLEAQTKAA